jgi:amino acid adenylation domain-containing protein/non-ribosomal peptide synthase protein (TIGR01720 family)
MENRNGITLPLSSAQTGIWAAYTLSSNPENYNIGEYLEIDGEIDLNILETAMKYVIKECNALQLSFSETADGLRQLLHPLDDWVPQMLDYSQLDNPLEQAKAYMLSEIKSARDIRRLPLFKYTIIKLDKNKHILYQCVHHIALDGYSGALTVQKLADYYNRLIDNEVLPKLNDVVPLDIKTLIDADAAYRTSTRFLRDRQYWQEKFADLPEALSLARNSAKEGEIIHYRLRLPQALDDLVKTMPVRLGCTQPQLLIALATVYLYRMSGQSDAVVGLPVMARMDAEQRQIPGMTSNILPIRFALSPTLLLSDVLAAVGKEVRGALRHQQYRYEDIIHDLNLLSINQPLIKTSINIENFSQNITFAGAKVTSHNLTNGPASDLNIFFFNYGENQRIELAFDANGALYTLDQLAVHAERMLALFSDMLLHIELPIGLQPLLSNAEKQVILSDFNHTASEIPPYSLAEMFERQAALTPDAVAVSENGESLTYRQLNQRANRLAHRIIASGCRPEESVGLLMGRSAHLVVAVLAVIKAGCCYLPLRISDPIERQTQMLNDGSVQLLLIDASRQQQSLPEVQRLFLVGDEEGLPLKQDNPNIRIHSDGLAYIMYTSGSTGKPKGIAVTHRNVLTLADDRRWKNGDHRRVLLHSPYAFDASTYELWVPLLQGGEVIVMPGDELDLTQLADTIAAQQVTALWLTAGLFRLISEERPDCLASVRCLIAGGDTLSKSAIETVLDRNPGLTVVNGYGPTETTTFASNYQMRAPVEIDYSIPIGSPMDNTQLYVLDGALQPMPVGSVGELYIAGSGLARGYVNQAAQTAERFVANPFGESGERMYRSGDMACWRKDGVLEFVGRADHLVKIRGFRIELAEVEHRLQQHPAIAQVIVTVQQDDRQNKQLAAYIVPLSGETPEPTDIRQWAGQYLPDFMVPATVTVLDALPLTANGKVNLKVLPKPTFALVQGRASRNPQEELLCGLFAEALGLDNVSIDDNFFDLGGHSLMATRLIGNIRKSLLVELTIRDLFNAPTVALLAECLAQKRPVRLPLNTYPNSEFPPLSFAQKRLWLVDCIDGKGATYNIPLALRLSGLVNVVALENAVQRLIDHHQVLRTLYRQKPEGDPYQYLLSDAKCPIKRISVNAEKLDDALAAAAAYPFDLSQDLPIRVTLFEVDEQQSILLILIHHIAGDGGSIAPLLNELSQGYNAYLRGHHPPAAPNSVQYIDYAFWQRELLGEESDRESLAAQQAAYWQARLRDLPEEIILPTDRPRPQIASYRGDSVHFKIDETLYSQLKRLARGEGATLFMVLQASVALLLYRLGAGEDIVLGTPIAGRTDDKLHDMIGYFANTLALRNDLSGNPNFRQLLQRVRENTLDAYGHQDIPFERLVEIINPPRSLARHPLFQVMLVLQNHDYRSQAFDGLEIAPQAVALPNAKFDLTFHFEEPFAASGQAGGELDGTIEFASDLFDRSSIVMMADRLLYLLATLVECPESRIKQINLLPPSEAHRLIHQWNETGYLTDNVSLAELFEKQVELTPQKIALTSPDGSMSYQTLNQLANRLAHRLIELGLTPEARVALLIERSAELIVAILAIIKSGGCYLPLRGSDPLERQQAMINDGQCQIILTDLSTAVLPDAKHIEVVSCRDLVRQERPQDNLNLSIRGQSLAYIMYTSGSTGVPKGIAVSQQSVAGLALDRQWRNGDHQRVLVHSPHAFDASTYEIWVPLLQGGEIIVAPKGELDIERLAQTIVEHNVSALWLTAGLFRLMAEERPQCMSSVRCLIAGGDVLPKHAVETMMSHNPDITIVNGYGPTETTTFAACYPMRPPLAASHAVPIGKPLDNTQLYVLDEQLQPVPIGVSGELYIAGNGLARGYVNHPSLTAERFIANPFSANGERMYRSGDTVRWRQSGVLEFVGRADQLVKIRGFRIELGEVETALLEHPDVAQAIVIAREDRQRKQLAAYVVLKSGSLVQALDIKGWAAQKLPDFMVPAAVVLLTGLPLTSNGKIDQKALPQPTFSVSEGRQPVGEKEHILSRLFAEVLALENVGAEDSFFDLGGDSITAIQLVSRARQNGIIITPKDIFQRKTVADLAAVATDASNIKTAPPISADGPLPATPIIHWLMEHSGPIDDFNQATLLTVPASVTERQLTEALRALIKHHDVLRMQLLHDEDGHWTLNIPPTSSIEDLPLIRVCDISGLNETQRNQTIKEAFNQAKARLAPGLGRMVQAVWLRRGDAAGQLLLVIHHLVVDGVSWRILLPDLQAAWRSLVNGETPNLPATTTPFKQWALRLTAEVTRFRKELPYWRSVLEGSDPTLSNRRLDPKVDKTSTSKSYSLTLSTEATQPLLGKIPALFNGSINDLLLTAFTLAIADWRRQQGIGSQTDVLLDLEGHGREEFSDTDLSRTVGWFTSMYPVRLDAGSHGAMTSARLSQSVKRIKTQLREIPVKGLGFGPLRYLDAESSVELKTLPTPQISFNYLGRFSAGQKGDWTIADEAVLLDEHSDPALSLSHVLALNAMIEDRPTGAVLVANWSWAGQLLSEQSVMRLAEDWFNVLTQLSVLTGHDIEIKELAPSAVSMVSMNQSALDKLQAKWKGKK